MGQNVDPRANVRDVIVHYHIFKNAGTSIDTSLSASFGSGWLSYDPDPVWTNVLPQEVLGVLESHPDLRAISSHQLRWPEPAAEGLRVFPLVLLRHPVDRVRSIYDYGTRVGNTVVTGKTFSEYVDWLLSPEGSIVARSFQTLFMSDDQALREIPEAPSVVTPAHLESARRRIDGLEMFGLVERFEESVATFDRVLRPKFPDLDLLPHLENASPGKAELLETRLTHVADSLGPRRYQRVIQENEADLELWHHAMAQFEARFVRAGSVSA
jgi:hypothetical protein